VGIQTICPCMGKWSEYPPHVTPRVVEDWW
jgi:hypothetical protein